MYRLPAKAIQKGFERMVKEEANFSFQLIEVKYY